MTRRFSVIALAAFATSGPVLAQSNVSISGMMDIGIYRDESPKWNVGPIQRSNLTFSGSEDLGGGYSAIFKLNHRFEPDTGTNESASKPFWHGESTVGVKGPIGTLRLGRALDALYSNDWAFDPWYYYDRIGSPAWDLWHYNFPSDPQANNGQADYGRLNNGVFYDSPVLGGFSAHLSATPEKRAGDANRGYGAALKYSHPVVSAMLASEKNSAGNKDTFIGLKGSVAGVALMGAYDVSKAGTSKAKALTVGVQYTIGAVTLNGGWGKVDVDGTKAEQVTGLGAIYALSKRTGVYADVADKRYPKLARTIYGAGIYHSF